jgi:plastocyanin
MEYRAKPDRRLVVLILLAAILVPSMVATELAVPSFQPKFGTSGAPGGTPPPGGPGKSKVASVVMPTGINFNKKLNFQPVTLVVVVGVNNTIQWSNQDSADHSVTFTAVPSGVVSQAISDSDVAPGDSFAITLSVPGTYSYHCTFHPFWMRATVIVK